MAEANKQLQIPEVITLPKNTNLIKFIQDVYDLSHPVGMGKIHYTPEPLSDEEAHSIADQAKGRLFETSGLLIRMDYVNGRACKMNIYATADGTLYIDSNWFDHTKAEFSRLLQRTKIKNVNLERDKATEAQIKKDRAFNPFSTQRGSEDD